MTTISRPTTFVDRSSAVRPISTTAGTNDQDLRVAIRPVTDQLRATHAGIPSAARFAAIAYRPAGDRTSPPTSAVMLTDGDDGIGNLVHLARALAKRAGARFVEPEAVCRWCGSPVSVDLDFCPTEPGRDCAGAHGKSETGYRLRVVDERGLKPAVTTPWTGYALGDPHRGRCAA